MTFDTSQQAVLISGTTELYEIDFGDHVEYYSILPRTISFDSGSGANNYSTLPIGRGEIQRNPEIGADSLELVLPLNPSMTKYLSEGSHGVIEIRIIRGFGDPEISPGNYKTFWFIGLVQDVKYTRTLLKAKMLSKEGLIFETLVPRVRSSSTCNNELYGPVCLVVRALFEQTFTVLEIQRAGTRLRLQPTDPSNSHFDEPDIDLGNGAVTPGWYMLGKCWESGYEGGLRHIVAHEWTSPNIVCFIELAAPIPDLQVSDTVTMVPGCDKRRLTCINKYDNFPSLVAFNRTPKKNPVTQGFTNFSS